MRSYSFCIALMSISLVPCGAPLAAQADSDASRWSLEITGGGAFPTSKLGSAELKTGFGLGANVQVRLQQHLSAYAGWEWHRFTSDQLVASATTDAEETGYTVGLRFAHPFAGEGSARRGARTAPGYWLRAGATIDHIELENAAGDIFSDTKHGLGWEAGAGITLPITDRLAFTPGARFRSLSRDLTVGTLTRSVTLSYVTATAGLTFTF